MIKRLENIDLPQERKSIKDFEFPAPDPSGYTVITADKVGKSFGEKQVYQDLDFEIIRGQKVCLVGPNGAGKSTLLKMLADVLKPDKGNIKLGHQVKRGYFSQTRLDVLNPNRNVLDELASAVSGIYPALQMRSLLGLFNFRGEDVFKSVRVLSGGEKSRLILAKLLIHPPNFILLDEPTTHLDIDGVEALTKAFQQYTGTLCFISHDLYFMREVADSIVEVQAGRLKKYPGGLGYYLEKKQQGQTLEQKHQKRKKDEQSQERKAKKQQKQEESLKIREAHQKHKQALKRVNVIKKDIRDCEQKMKELETESYVKSRFLANAFGKDPQLLKEYGRRLKEIPKELRGIESRIKALTREKDRMSK